MPKRDSFLDLDDYGRETNPDFCSRVRIFLEFEDPSNYYIDLEDFKTGKPLAYEALSRHDQATVDKWVKRQIDDLLSEKIEQYRD